MDTSIDGIMKRMECVIMDTSIAGIMKRMDDLVIIVLNDNKEIKKLQQQVAVLCDIIEDHNIALRCNHSDIVGKLSDYGYGRTNDN